MQTMKQLATQAAYKTGYYEFGKLSKSQGGNPNCVFCSQKISAGDYYLKSVKNWRHQPSMHKSCVDEISKTIDKKKPEIESQYKKLENVYSKKKAAHKKALDQKKDKKEWRKHLIKEALKKANILVSKISITYPNDWGTSGDASIIKVAPPLKDVKAIDPNVYRADPFFWIKFDKTTVRVINPIDNHGLTRSNFVEWYDLDKSYPNQTKIPLEDPEALEKIAEAMLDQAVGNLKPYMRKKKKKK